MSIDNKGMPYPPKFFFELNIGDIFASNIELGGSRNYCWVKYSSRTVREYSAERGVSSPSFYMKDDNRVSPSGENINSFKYIVKEAARKHQLRSSAPSI